MVTLHRWSMAPEIEAADNVVLLLAENLTELHPKLVSNPQIAAVRVPMPDEETRRRVIAVCQPERRRRLAWTGWPTITAGLRAVQIQAILQPPPAAARTEAAEEERVRFLKAARRGSKDAEARARKLAGLTRGMSPEEMRKLVGARLQATEAETEEAASASRKSSATRSTGSSPAASARSSSASASA